MEYPCLALETSSARASVALATSPGEVFSEQGASRANHSEEIVELTQQALQKAGSSIADIRGLIVGSGPGSFTGLRIGYSFLKGLAVAQGRPLYAVSSARGMAEEFCSPQTLVAVLLDARRNEFFFEARRANEQGDWEVVQELHICSFEKVKLVLDEHNIRHPGDSLCLVSDESDWLAGLFGERVNVPQAGAARGLVQAVERGEGELFQGAFELAECSPNYLRAVAAKTIREREQEAP